MDCESGEGSRRMVAALGGGEISDVTRLGGGLDGVTHAFRLRGRRLVVKRSKPGATDAGQEFDNLTLALRASVPTPEPVALDEAGDWFGTPALVMTALPGRHNLHPSHEDQWLQELARALAAIHDTSIDGVPERIPPFWQRWEPWDGCPDGGMGRVATAIEELRLVADLQPQVFSHQDYHPGNVVFDGDRLVGVVDWMHAAREPREAAVAFCRKDLAIHPGGKAPDHFLAAYEAETGYHLDIDLWDVLYGARALQWGHRWVPSFAELGVPLTAGHIADASAAFVDEALQRRGLKGRQSTS